MSTIVLGSEEGTTDSGLPGASANFPHTSFMNAPYRRLGENRFAILSGVDPKWKPSWNDLMYSHRDLYDRDVKNPNQANKTFFSWLADSAVSGKNSGHPTSQAAAATITDPKNGRQFTGGPSSVAGKGGIAPSAAGLWTMADVGATGVAIQAMPTVPAAVLPGPYVAINVNAAVEQIRLFRFNATTWRIERVVASTPATELDITTTAALDPLEGSAFGLRRDGTRCRAFVNGRMIADFTLNAAAQALAATGVAVQAVAGGMLMDNIEVFSALA